MDKFSNDDNIKDYCRGNGCNSEQAVDETEGHIRPGIAVVIKETPST